MHNKYWLFRWHWQSKMVKLGLLDLKGSEILDIGALTSEEGLLPGYCCRCVTWLVLEGPKEAGARANFQLRNRKKQEVCSPPSTTHSPPSVSSWSNLTKINSGWIVLHCMELAFCYSTYQLVDIWVTSTSWLLWIMLLWAFAYTSLDMFSLGQVPRSGIAGSRGKPVLTFLRN